MECTYRVPEGVEVVVNDPAMTERFNEVVSLYKEVFALP